MGNNPSSQETKATAISAGSDGDGAVGLSREPHKARGLVVATKGPRGASQTPVFSAQTPVAVALPSLIGPFVTVSFTKIDVNIPAGVFGGATFTVPVGGGWYVFNQCVDLCYISRRSGSDAGKPLDFGPRAKQHHRGWRTNGLCRGSHCPLSSGCHREIQLELGGRRYIEGCGSCYVFGSHFGHRGHV